jgi:hypothetical protein
VVLRRGALREAGGENGASCEIFEEFHL